jgi:hypothetical protein
MFACISRGKVDKYKHKPTIEEQVMFDFGNHFSRKVNSIFGKLMNGRAKYTLNVSDGLPHTIECTMMFKDKSMSKMEQFDDYAINTANLFVDDIQFCKHIEYDSSFEVYTCNGMTVVAITFRVRKIN